MWLWGIMCCAVACVVDRVGVLGDAGVVRDLRIVYACPLWGGGVSSEALLLGEAGPAWPRVLGSRFRLLW